jgi:alkylation response protein AidB-like acyl-CoA dehydrogenase
MDLNLSETQSILVNTASRFLEREAQGLFREVEQTEAGYSPDLWGKIAELGWLGLIFPEAYGGTGGSFLDLVLLLEQMGKALFPGPFIPTVVCGLSVLHSGSPKQREELLPGLVEGERILSPAVVAPDPKIRGGTVQDENVRVRGQGQVLSGTRLFVPFGHVANGFLYRAVSEKGPAVFLVRAPAAGLRCTPLQSMGGEKPCELALDGVEVSASDVLGVEGGGDAIVERMNDWGALAESAFIAGLLRQVLDLAVEHAQEREQFGRKIGSFQAIQHQCADMATDVDQVKFLTYQAAWKLDQGVPARKEISMAKAWASDASRRVCLLGVKIHGGMGVSEEHDMQLYFRRAKPSELAFGDGHFHREIVAQEMGL